MKIAYSCAGEGFGHGARTLALAEILALEHQVEVFCPQEIEGFFREKRPNLKTRRIPGFSFVKRQDRVLYLATIRRNLPKMVSFPWTVKSFSKILKEEGFDAVISDFEPTLAWAGRSIGLPVIQLNHPGIVQKFFTFRRSSLLAAATAFLLEGPWTSRIHCSFFHGDVGPILRPEIRALNPYFGDTFLINVKPEYRPMILKVLKDFPQLKFALFPNTAGNYEKALESCRAVISSAGHQTLSESLYLGKPVIALPQKKQWEQTLNAQMLVTTGRGVSCDLENLAAGLKDFLLREEEIRRKCTQEGPGFNFEDGTKKAVKLIQDALGIPRSKGRPGKSAVA